MATPKQTKTAPAAGTTEAAKPQSTRASSGGGDKFFRVYGEDKKPSDPGKVPPQARVIINAVESAGKGGITRDDLVKNLTAVLVTKQPVGRIVSYYQKLIQECGAVTMTASAPVAPVAKAA